MDRPASSVARLTNFWPGRLQKTSSASSLAAASPLVPSPAEAVQKPPKSAAMSSTTTEGPFLRAVENTSETGLWAPRILGKSSVSSTSAYKVICK